MRNLVIGTAGHIDHGKTSLVRALTGINTDTLKEEQKRGITVNLGFAYIDIEGHTVGIVDVPGHEKLIKNMLAGVCGMDLILLTVAADDGIMPQTREHMEIIKFLRVKNIIVVITKVDLVSIEQVENVKESIRKEFDLHQFVEFSIHRKETTEHIRQMIRDNILAEEVVSEEVFRLPIDRVFSVKGQGVVVTGSSLSGRVRVGDELEVLPTKQRVRVRGIQSFGKPREEAYKRTRVALNLGGVKKEDISRGKIIASKDCLSPSQIIDVKMTVSQHLKDPIKHLEEVKLYYLASEIKCRVKLINQKQIHHGEVVYGQLLLDEPIYASNKDLGVLRRINPIKTIAGIEIINVYGEYISRKDESFQDTLKLYDEDNTQALLTQYINQHPFVKIEELKRKLNIDDEMIRADDHLLIFEDQSCLTKETHRVLKKALLERLKQFHDEFPHEIGLNKQICQHDLKLDYISNRTFQYFLSSVAEVVVAQDRVKLENFSIKYNKEEQKIVDAIKNYLNSFEYKPPKLEEILNDVRGTNVKSLYFSLIKEQALIKIDQDIVLTKLKYEEMIFKFDEFFKNNKVMMIQDGRDLLNTSRKYIVAFLEYLDKIGYTKRTEEGRIKKQ